MSVSPRQPIISPVTAPTVVFPGVGVQLPIVSPTTTQAFLPSGTVRQTTATGHVQLMGPTGSVVQSTPAGHYQATAPGGRVVQALVSTTGLIPTAAPSLGRGVPLGAVPATGIPSGVPVSTTLVGGIPRGAVPTPVISALAPTAFSPVAGAVPGAVAAGQAPRGTIDPRTGLVGFGNVYAVQPSQAQVPVTTGAIAAPPVSPAAGISPTTISVAPTPQWAVSPTTQLAAPLTSQLAAPLTTQLAAPLTPQLAAPVVAPVAPTTTPSRQVTLVPIVGQPPTAALFSPLQSRLPPPTGTTVVPVGGPVVTRVATTQIAPLAAPAPQAADYSNLTSEQKLTLLLQKMDLILARLPGVR